MERPEVGSEDADLRIVIARAIAAHDPLDPWLVVSNYDEHYWHREAELAEQRGAQAPRVGDVRNALNRPTRSRRA